MNLTLLPGTSLVEMESEANALNTTLALPDALRKRAIRVGRVVQSNFTRRDAAFLGVDSVLGSRVILDARFTGKHVEGMRWIIRHLVQTNRDQPRQRPKFSTPILAILADQIEVGVPVHPELRCKFCGPAVSKNSEQAMLLVPGRGGAMYCPRCKRMESGGTYGTYEGEDLSS